MYDILLGSQAYIPGRPIKKSEPLSRYLPPIPDGVISTWLQKNIPQGSWILDPFCASPRLAVEAARAGYRLIVTANNPIARFLLEMAAVPPRVDELQAALAELASSYKADERIEPHIRSLYNTHCARCGQIVSAEAFYWEQGSTSPYMRVYTCPFCGDNGEHPCIPFDIENAQQFIVSGLHKARALERIVASNDQDRIHVEQALSVYLPRALYALITIVNKIEGLNISPSGQKNLAALLLHTFDLSNAMWKVPSSRERRRQLTIPRHFRENNIWLMLEQGIELWSYTGPQELVPSIPISIWPELPPERGGICIHEGKLISIADSLAGLNIKSVCAALPRPNQAFWTLSALWAGWLWGREAVGTFKSVLHRQRYDWGWHTTALASVFKQIVNVLDPSTYILGLMGETEPGFIAAALAAAGYAGCDLKGIAIRHEEDQTQIVWKCKPEPKAPQSRSSLSETGIETAKRYLESRGEPTSYLNTISAAFVNIIHAWPTSIDNPLAETKKPLEIQLKTGDISDQTEQTPSLVYSSVYNAAREALTYRSGFLQFNLQDISNVEPSTKPSAGQDTLFSIDIENKKEEEGESTDNELTFIEAEAPPEKERPTRSSDVSESILLWLRDTTNVNHTSITANYEGFVIDILASNPGCTEEDIDVMMCEKFPGLYTPDPEFIRICLDSYGEKYEPDSNRWHIRSEDIPSGRKIDLENALLHIHQIGSHLGLESIDQKNDDTLSISWIDGMGELNFWFFPTATANISEIVFYNNQSPGKGFIVLPGSRANLVIYKLRRDPRLSRAFNPDSGSWHCLKFRHLRSLADNPLLNRENLDQLLRLDPLTYSTPQLRLI